MTDLHVYSPEPDELAYTFGGRAPVRRLRPGDALEVYTEDCFGGRVTGVDTLPTRVVEFPFLNPVSGPFHVEGAAPGDTLALHFVSLQPARDWAVSSTFPHFGALTSTSHTATLQPPLEERVWIYDLAGGVARFSARNSDFVVDLPLDPMHGTVGVAPAAFEARMTITPDAHGGNMDTPELRAGVTAYFGVNVDGALFALGDGHARQGHGEVSGVAVECAMRTTLIVELLKGVPTPWPRLESDGHLMSTGSARPLEDAYRISQHDLVTWVAGLTGLDELDALQLVSQAGEAPVGNVCDTNYTMVAKVAKRYLRGARAYDGVHARLRERAATMGA
ncbi:acetamidase/formamidase family protein [Dactylosporangium matsuzakiense]|uniref:acetamidase/formamidase family protein n=1 Tax=Dactylosporangium matsuzakiense TaxID=53360 RepID=UPI0021C2C89F|nr:acetamidase/formamidase family protein [Dactylosporangium matsuzakiense]UWZ45360.1 acetamidase/formamidase family protein [Dactylosporangium matsuzakiense]